MTGQGLQLRQAECSPVLPVKRRDGRHCRCNLYTGEMVLLLAYIRQGGTEGDVKCKLPWHDNMHCSAAVLEPAQDKLVQAVHPSGMLSRPMEA